MRIAHILVITLVLALVPSLAKAQSSAKAMEIRTFVVGDLFTVVARENCVFSEKSRANVARLKIATIVSCIAKAEQGGLFELGKRFGSFKFSSKDIKELREILDELRCFTAVKLDPMVETNETKMVAVGWNKLALLVAVLDLQTLTQQLQTTDH